MSDEKQDKGQKAEPIGQPSDGPLKNEPTPERAHEEKAKQVEEACPKER